uniref:Peptidase S1 domain-containing protein n=1 Tax=Panagrolaimus davidi TaxID=227884 RepID=A0A914PAV2_9BILA
MLKVDIWNGVEVKEGHRHIAQIFVNGVIRCTGFIAKINDDKTVTIVLSAHCLTKWKILWRTYEVYTGSYGLKKGQKLGVKRMRQQPGFFKKKFGKDVGIIVTDGEIDPELHDFVIEAATITDHGFESPKECDAAGFGFYKSPKVDTDVLRKATFVLLTEPDCLKDYPAKVVGEVCASNIYRNGAKGDSGSPLLCDNVVFGVLSMVTRIPRFDRATIFQRLDDPDTRMFLISEGLIPAYTTTPPEQQ